MSWLVPALLLAVVGIPLAIAFARMGELFVLSVRAGRVAVVRGRIPPRLLDEIRDVASHAGLDGLVLRCVLADGRPRIEARGGDLPASTAQRLRNVLGMWSVAQIRSAPPRRR